MISTVYLSRDIQMMLNVDITPCSVYCLPVQRYMDDAKRGHEAPCCVYCLPVQRYTDDAKRGHNSL